MVVVGLAATIGMNFQVTIPPFARDVLGGDAATFGFLMTASGLGSVAAALFLATRSRPSPWAIGVGATMLGAGLLAIAVVPVFALAIPALAIAGFGAIWMAANGNTLIQATVPDALRGRVISVYTTVFAGSTPIGALFAGALASRWGAVVALGVGGILTVLVGVARPPLAAPPRGHGGAVAGDPRSARGTVGRPGVSASRACPRPRCPPAGSACPRPPAGSRSPPRRRSG